MGVQKPHRAPNGSCNQQHVSQRVPGSPSAMDMFKALIDVSGAVRFDY